MLCDVIAQIVTDRASRIAVLSRPVELFEDKATVGGKGFYPLKETVMAGSSIVVASSNNNAVKNITQELPARKKIASDEHGRVDYFAEVMNEVFAAQKVLDEEKRPLDAWGVIAAALGNASNRRSFSKGFFRDEFIPKAGPAEARPATDDAEVDDGVAAEEAASEELPPSMKQLLEAASGNDYRRHQDAWHVAKGTFLELQAEFGRQRAILVGAEQAAVRLDESRSRLRALQDELAAACDAVFARQDALVQLKDALAVQCAIVEAQKTVVSELSASWRPGLWDRVLALLGRETARMAAARKALLEPTQTLARSSADLAGLSKDVGRAGAELAQAQARRGALEAQEPALRRSIDGDLHLVQAAQGLGARHFPDNRFWSLPAAERHRASLLVGEALDRLRAKVFLAAVELHRLTILANAGKFIANLRAVNGMLTGASKNRLAIEHRPLLWDAFFFVVPVVSTTLASFDRLFAGMGQESLGWLLIDEAGQATPQAAAGALWRSRRAVVVGDPLQIEPVFTVPLQLAEDLRQRRGVPVDWSPVEESVQTLTDRVTPHGSWVHADTDASAQEPAPQRLWTGVPLRTHRRCDDPMFSVANRIAYAQQMVPGNVDGEGRPVPSTIDCILGDSAWLDVRSERVNHPVSDDECDVLVECLEQLRRVPATVGSQRHRAKVYVISPFRKVATACRARVERNRFAGIECGTVHTFQGKEADIVFLVLGTAPGQPGAGARAWAASKPNLLNVAITRAKSRLYVIGNAGQWGGLDYFRELCAALPVRRAVLSG